MEKQNKAKEKSKFIKPKEFVKQIQPGDFLVILRNKKFEVVDFVEVF